MQSNETIFWLQQGEERLRVLMALFQPTTAQQLASRLGKSLRSISEHIRQLRVYRVLTCLNPTAHQSRLYWLTDEGKSCRDLLAGIYNTDIPSAFPTVDWDVYGDLCFRHRHAVLLALKGRMRPPQVKKSALAHNSRLRMSIDNCREVLYWMRNRGVVKAVRPRAEYFPYYELTGVGRSCQSLLRQAMMTNVA